MELTDKDKAEIAGMTLKEAVSFWNILQFSLKFIVPEPDPKFDAKLGALMVRLSKEKIYPERGKLISIVRIPRKPEFDYERI